MKNLTTDFADFTDGNPPAGRQGGTRGANHFSSSLAEAMEDRLRKMACAASPLTLFAPVQLFLCDLCVLLWPIHLWLRLCLPAALGNLYHVPRGVVKALFAPFMPFCGYFGRFPVTFRRPPSIYWSKRTNKNRKTKLEHATLLPDFAVENGPTT